MKKSKFFIMLSATFLILLPLQNSSAANDVYGWELMSNQERIQHRETMRNFKTNEERDRYRIKHHEQMQARAKEKGVSLPDMPGMGDQDQTRDQMRDQDRMHDGTGMGSGGGMGSGAGGGR